MQSAPSTVSSSADLRWVVLLMTALCGAVNVAWVYQSMPLRSANDRSRWATVRALVEQNTYIIDATQTDPDDRSWATIDLVRHDDHFYSTKPPLLPWLIAQLVNGIEATTGWTLADHTTEVTRVVLLLINALPMTLALYLLGSIAAHYSHDAFASAVVVLAAGIGSMHQPFVATLNNHTIGLWSAAFTLACAFRFHRSSKPWTRRLNAAAAGLFAMWTCCNELPAALFGITLFAWFLRRDWKTTLVWFAPAALVPLVGFFATVYDATGGWKPFYMYYGTEKYEFIYNGRPSYWMQPQGIDRNVDSPLTYAMHCLVGHHGLFSLTPILLLACCGVFVRPHRRRWLSFWSLAAAGLSVAVLAFFLTRTENYNYGGVSVALRWMLWLTPFWGLLMITPLTRFRGSVLRTAIVVCLAWSIFSALSCGPNPWQHNYLFRGLEQAGWISY